jgi:hypothetical protein
VKAPRFSLAAFVLPVVLASSITMFGCGGSSASEPAAMTGSGLSRAPVAPAAHGPVRLFGAALGDVPLSPVQRTDIEKLAADAETRQVAIRSARQDLALAIASQVDAGAVDRAALAPKVDAVVAAVAAAQPADRAAFERLHAILGPDQRTAFVNAVDVRIHERVDQVRERHPLRQWAKDLGLTDDQRTQLQAIVKSRVAAAKGDGEMGHGVRGDGHGAKVMEAFKQDRFVIDELDPARDRGPQIHERIDRMLGMIEAALPVLTASQRTIAAQKIRARAEQGEDAVP